MANCSICNIEIKEGYICVDCANQQRNQNNNAAVPPQSGQVQKPASGFSLNGLLDGGVPKEPPPLPTQAATPIKPAPVNIAPRPVAPVPPLQPIPVAPTIPAGSPQHHTPVPPTPSAAPTTQAPAGINPLPPTTPAVPSPEPTQPVSQAPRLNKPTPAITPPPSASPPKMPVSSAPEAPPVNTATGNSNSNGFSLSGVEKPNNTTMSPSVPVVPVSTPKTPLPKPVAPMQNKAQTFPQTDEEATKEVFSSDVTGYGDEELEIAILSGIMKDTCILQNLKGKGLISGLFSTRYSRAIFQSTLSLREENPELSSLDKIVIKNKMKQLNLWDATIQSFLDRILNETPPLLSQALHYLDLMKEQALKRKLKEVAHEIHDYIDSPVHGEGENIETFTNKVIHNVRNIQKAKTTKRINLVRDEMTNIIADVDNREVTGEIDIIGYSFEPMHYLNMAISGFRKGFMYAIAGAPRRGKTTFTLELATRVASLNKIPVLFFTYEQTKKNLTYRLLAKESRLNPDSLQRKRIRSDMIVDAKFNGGCKKMQEYMDYFYIVEATKEDTVDRIRSYAYNVMQDFNTEDIMIFIDYIQKMPLSRTYTDEKFKVEEISTELKGLSIELNNPIMTISSLSKEGCFVDATPDAERPTMYHCKGSGDLEYDLDCAMIQAKDWGDTKELFQQLQCKAEELGKDPTRIPKVDVVNLYLDKNRDAPEGIFSTIQYLFFIEDNKFIELGPKFDDDRFRFSKIEELVDKLIQANFIIFYDKPKDSGYNKGRVSIKLKNF